MATCKECRHFSYCTRKGDFLHYHKTVCNWFTDASRFVKVVRCEKCKHLEVVNDGKVYAVCKMTGYEFLPFGTDTLEHFCGFGEVKE